MAVPSLSPMGRLTLCAVPPSAHPCTLERYVGNVADRPDVNLTPEQCKEALDAHKALGLVEEDPATQTFALTQLGDEALRQPKDSAVSGDPKDVVLNLQPAIQEATSVAVPEAPAAEVPA